MAEKLKLLNKIDENTWVKFPATIHIMRLGYNYVSYNDEIKNGYVDHNTKIFRNIFKASIERINQKSFSEEEITKVLTDIHESMKYNDLGRDLYNWLTNPGDKVKLIDFDTIENNDFSVVNELIFGDELIGSFRPDINILINGMPIGFLEVKPMNNEGGIQVEFDRMVNKRFKSDKLKKYFNLIQLICFSNNMEYENDTDRLEPRAGSFYSTPNGSNTEFNFFREERRRTTGFTEISDDCIRYVLEDNGYNPNIAEDEDFKIKLDRNTPCNKFCTSIFDHKRLMFLLKYGILYLEENKDGIMAKEKHIMRYPQFFASIALIEKLQSGQKTGIIWHTQGSGKTELTIYLNKILTDYYAKNGIIACFYYVADRLDLIDQTSQVYTNCYYSIDLINSRTDFASSLKKPLKRMSDKKSTESIGFFTVVNIQKFSENLPLIENDYNIKIQKIFFVDEIQRSYSTGTGEFYKNLMYADKEAIIIALTGTPLLKQKERSNIHFGGYIHKYFYDKSIADGYTLKIMREEIETKVKSEILQNLSIDVKGKIKADIFADPIYYEPACKYIANDFKQFRLDMNDSTVGGMIVCRSNPQAEAIHDWFQKNSDLKTKLILSDCKNENDVINLKENQAAFKDPNSGIDLMIVNLMLTTGYDVKRLKKMYLLRAPKDHSLLQTIARVNRRYTSPSGVEYRYGYISDFADIEAEYNKAINDYQQELNDALLDEDSSTNIDPRDVVNDIGSINEEYHAALAAIEERCSIQPKANFEKYISHVKGKAELLELQNLLTKIKNCRTEFILSRCNEKVAEIDSFDINSLLKIVSRRIDFLRIADEPFDMMSLLSNDEIAQIVFEFVSGNKSVLDITKNSKYYEILSDDIKNLVSSIAYEVSQMSNQDDTRIIELNSFLRDLFDRLKFIDEGSVDEIKNDLSRALETARGINEENKRIADEFEGDNVFALAYQEITNSDAFNIVTRNKDEFTRMFKLIQANYKSLEETHHLALQSKMDFLNNLRSKVARQLAGGTYYRDLHLRDYLASILEVIYKYHSIY